MKYQVGLLALLAALTASALIAAAQSDDDQNPYADDAQQVAQVRKQHLTELMKVPHVRGVATVLNARGEIVLAVEVDNPDHLDEVSSEIPSTLDGFPVDVEVARDAEPSSHHHGNSSSN
jgi:hypothetical protein